MLNDILDLCIEKSKGGVFYSFYWSSEDSFLGIAVSATNNFYIKRYNENELEKALKFMENE